MPAARYVWRHFAVSPSRRDITRPPEDLSWRTSSRLSVNLGILALLGGLAAFIFTPVAERLGQSPRFPVLLMTVVGGAALWFVSQGIAKGRIRPLLRGFNQTYDRLEQPGRFWASAAWNSAFGFLSLWLALQLNEDVDVQMLADRCNGLSSVQLTPDRFSACYELVRQRPDANAYLNLGIMLLDSGAYDEAVSDFSRAHQLAPSSPWPLANRGLAFAWKKDRSRAQRDFDAVRAADPGNPVMLRGEALLAMNGGNTEMAVDRLTASMVRDPDNLWALRRRAELYWDLGEVEKSRNDDHRWVELMAEARRNSS